jgi:hypothetical protein
MLKVMAFLRTLVLAALVAYTVWAMPWGFAVTSRTFDEQYALCAASLAAVLRGAWMAIGWIAIDTLVSWLLVPKKKPPVPAPAPVPSPTPPPPTGHHEPDEPPHP